MSDTQNEESCKLVGIAVSGISTIKVKRLEKVKKIEKQKIRTSAGVEVQEVEVVDWQEVDDEIEVENGETRWVNEAEAEAIRQEVEKQGGQVEEVGSEEFNPSDIVGSLTGNVEDVEEAVETKTRIPKRKLVEEWEDVEVTTKETKKIKKCKIRAVIWQDRTASTQGLAGQYLATFSDIIAAVNASQKKVKFEIEFAHIELAGDSTVKWNSWMKLGALKSRVMGGKHIPGLAPWRKADAKVAVNAKDANMHITFSDDDFRFDTSAPLSHTSGTYKPPFYVLSTNSFYHGSWDQSTEVARNTGGVHSQLNHSGMAAVVKNMTSARGPIARATVEQKVVTEKKHVERVKKLMWVDEEHEETSLHTEMHQVDTQSQTNHLTHEAAL